MASSSRCEVNPPLKSNDRDGATSTDVKLQSGARNVCSALCLSLCVRVCHVCHVVSVCHVCASNSDMYLSVACLICGRWHVSLQTTQTNAYHTS